MYLVEQTEKIEHHDDDQITNWFIIKRCYPEIYSIFATLLGICCFKLKASTINLFSYTIRISWSLCCREILIRR